MIKILILLMALLLLLTIGYPILISESSHNHTELKEFVSQVPDKYLVGLDSIELLNEDTKFKSHGQSLQGFYYCQWYDDMQCTLSKIYSKDLDIIWHELWHHYELCILRQTTSSEKLADKFMWSMS